MSPVRAAARTDQPALPLEPSELAATAHVECQDNLEFLRDLGDIIDVEIKILPVKELEREMSSGVPYYERAERDPAGPRRSGRPAGADWGGAVNRLATLGGPVNIAGTRDVRSTRRLRHLRGRPTLAGPRNGDAR